MLKNSVFLKLLLVLLALCGLLTLIAVVSVNDESGGGKVNTPTEEKTEASVPETETLTPETEGGYSGPNVDLGDGRTIVATNSSDNVYFGWMENGSHARYLAVVDEGMKPNTKYQITWSISDSINTVYYGIYLMYQTPGMEFPCVLAGENLYSNSYTFTTDSTEKQYLYFYVAQGDYDMMMDMDSLCLAIEDSVIFTLYEIAE